MGAVQNIDVLKAGLKDAFAGDDADIARDALRRFLNAGSGTAATQMAANRLRDFLKRHPANPARVALLTSFTADPLEPHLTLSEFLAERALEFLNVPYEQWSSTLSHSGALDDFKPDVVFLLLHLEDVAPLLARRHLACADKLGEEADRLVGTMRASIEAFRERSSTPVVLATLIAAERGVERYFDRRVTPSRAANIEALNLSLSEIATQLPNVYVFDYAATVTDFGRRRWFDHAGHHHTHASIASVALPELATELSGFIDAMTGTRDKVLALDLDNTLWHGIVGEDGVDGIALGGGWPGNAFHDFQAFAANLQASGVALAIVSKNNEADAREVFETHTRMPIGWDDFAEIRVNWQPKFENLLDISSELALGLDRFVFADDNPLEIDVVRDQLPQLKALHLDGSASHFADAVLRAGQFYAASLTQEDRTRAEGYQAEKLRGTQKRNSASPEDFLAGLDLQLELRAPRKGEIERVAQLCSRTNQFNLTTIRYDTGQILELLEDDAANLRVAKLVDRYGDYGLIGLVVTRDREGEDACEIESFLMSCRVLGRKVENTILAFVEDAARTQGLRYLIGHYRETPKNGVAATFFADNGFEPEGGEGRFIRDLRSGEPLALPSWIDLKTEEKFAK